MVGRPSTVNKKAATARTSRSARGQRCDTERPQEEKAPARSYRARMNGTSATTGQHLAGIAHLKQSIRDILATPIGSRVMRRDYGSRLPALIDAPMNRETLMQIYAATVEALARWEPRIEVERVQASSAAPGRLALDISGVYTPDGTPLLIEGIEVH